MSRRAFLLPSELPYPGSWRFALFTPAEVPPRAALLFLPPWAEEMNKTRRAVTQAVSAFAAAGFATLQLDLYGCGDSDGDFEQASWALWQQDALAGLAWLHAQHPGLPVVAWGLRAGCLLASELAQTATPAAQLWWQPMPQGKAVLQQFLRLQLAAQLGGGERGPAPKALLEQGQTVEIAGYRLPPALADGLARAQLQAPAQPALWLEASSQQPPLLLPGSSRLIEGWTCPRLQQQALGDNAPWAATELEDCPQLVQASVNWLQQVFPA